MPNVLLVNGNAFVLGNVRRVHDIDIPSAGVADRADQAFHRGSEQGPRVLYSCQLTVVLEFEPSTAQHASLGSDEVLGVKATHALQQAARTAEACVYSSGRIKARSPRP